MKRAHLALALALTLPLSAGGAAAETPGGATSTDAATPAPSVGPHDRLPVPGAAVARSSEELAAMVADPKGPREIELGAQVYRGDLIIKRPVAIRGMRGTVLAGTGRDTVVHVEASDVTLENVVIRESGRRHTAEDAGVKATGERITLRDVKVEETLFGLSLQACKTCLVEGVHVLGWGDDAELRGDGIKLWESNDSVVRRSVVERSRDVVVWYTKRATVEDLVVTGGRYGTHFMHGNDAVVRNSRFEGNVVGIFVMYSKNLRLEDNILAGARGAAGVGLGFKESDAIQVRRNWIVANTTGAYLDNTPRTPDAPVVWQGNLIALNDVGMRLLGVGKGVSLRANDFHQNATLVDVGGGSDALTLDARENHYSDYEGYDLDGDGTGDVAYEVQALSSELVESSPSLKVFAGTAAMGLVDTVSRAVPLLSKKKLYVDPAPVSRRPERITPRTP